MRNNSRDILQYVLLTISEILLSDFMRPPRPAAGFDLCCVLSVL